MQPPRTYAAALVAAALLLTACTSSSSQTQSSPTTEPSPTTTSESPSPSTGTPSATTTTTPTEQAEEAAPARPPHPVSIPAYFDREFSGGNLRLGTVREQTTDYTSYDASYRSGRFRVTGVLNVPTGRGPFPAVVLAHGFIDPAYYVSGQGMTRERGYLAVRDYVAFHVDYRNHAGSSDDPLAARHLRLGYSVDVINAVTALRQTEDVPVDDDRIALMGRSMGGGVVYKALEMAPGLVDAASVWAPVSSLESENYDRWIRNDATRSELDAYVERAYGLPGQLGTGRFWREVSARTYFDRITEPLLIVQGGNDSTCPPPWARATYRAARNAGVDARLAWYPIEEHAFGPRFFAAMDRTTRFFTSELA